MSAAMIAAAQRLAHDLECLLMDLDYQCVRSDWIATAQQALDQWAMVSPPSPVRVKALQQAECDFAYWGIPCDEPSASVAKIQRSE